MPSTYNDQGWKKIVKAEKLYERLVYLGIMGAQLKFPLKQLKHHDTIGIEALKETLN